MVSFMVPVAGGTAAVLAGVLVAGSGTGLSSDLALTIVSCIGNGLARLLILLPLYTFLRPIIKENTVGDRTAYGHVLTMVSGAAWGLYAVITWKDSRISTVINAACFVFQLVYVGVFIWFTAGFLLLALVGSGVLAWIVVVKVIRKGEMDKRTIATIASVVSCVTYTAVAYDVDVSNMDPLVEVLFNLLNAIAAVPVYLAYMSTPVDNYIGVPNVIGVVLLLLQLVLYAMHCRGKPEEEEANTEEIYNASPDYGTDLVALFASPSPHAQAQALPEIEVVIAPSV